MRLVTRGFGNAAAYLPTRGFTAAAVESATGLVALTLHARSTALTLETRSAALTLPSRSTALTLEDR
jgi:hypothetical protein